MEFLYWFGRIVRWLLVINIVFIIHEYGHLSELRKRNVPLQEFSLGMGPILYQLQGKDTVYNVRAIPVVAGVRPTKEGFDSITTLPFTDFFLICFAGVRNNIIVGIVMILTFFWCGVIKKQPVTLVYFYKTTSKILFDTIILFAYFFRETFARREYITSHTRTIPIPITPPYFLQQFLYWNLILGLWNIMPLYPMDGGRIFASAVEHIFGNNASEIFTYASFIVFMFFIWKGISNIQFVEFGDWRYKYRYED